LSIGANILITGAGGQLGQALAATQPLLKGLTAIYATRPIVDITQKAGLADYLQAHPIKFVVNCAAYTNVDQAETDKLTARAINTLGPENLASLAEEFGFTLLHISTDYVFKGNIAQPLDETMPPEPINYYGHTKLMGEQAIQAYPIHFYIIRTSWLYSPIGQNSFTRLQERIVTGQPIRIAYDQVGSPTYAGDLALAIWQILEKLYQEPHRYPPGIYHYANQGVASRYDFAWNACKMAQWERTILPAQAASFIGFAPRPAYTVLATDHIQATFGLTIRHWQEGLAACLSHIEHR
jgi:dTDP-4-dehydrorhamnose reductase